MEQLIEPLRHAAHGGVHIGGGLLHQIALLAPCRGQALREVAHQLFQHLGGLLTGGADKRLNGRCHDVVQRIGECCLHRLVHAHETFLQALADTFVQLLQGHFALATVVGDVHQRLLGGDQRIQRIDPVLQILYAP
ncbi:hypothetical protein FQZ97_614090 [compost metagenome]